MHLFRLDRASILLGLALYLLIASVSLVFMVLYMYLHFFATFFALPFSELSLVGLVVDLVDYPSFSLTQASI